MKNKLLIVSRDQEYFTRKVQELDLPDLEILSTKDRELTDSYAREANIFLALPLFIKPYLKNAEKLQWVQSIFAGVEVLTEEGMRSDYTLTNVKDTYGEAMTEYVFSYLLAFERDTFHYLSLQKDHVWKQKPYGTVQGKVLAVAGAGSIGSDIARIAKAFGMKTIGLRTEKGAVEHFDEIYTTNETSHFLRFADYVISVLPKTEATNHFFSKQAFIDMKDDAVFMNVGRGNAVDEQALIEALHEKRIRAAVLDVFREEPLPEQSKLWDIQNLYLTPHVSGYVLTDRVFEIFSENYMRFLEGRALLYTINFQKGY